ncbi:hypothetical protein BCR34DRAFT_350155 [Clohesyomyces aquaticus]|uniref:Uncharacterized protein n=1 Tax=Clohesyomyces aquaticus TaxID=1231657 RepID=A0A1Y1ZJJ8_9PLEO|nr:hypothetical protein BCR34DRAFT_350155 [Clohesyomyces aquaticus]
MSIKIRDLPYYNLQQGILQVEYTDRPSNSPEWIYWDLSIINCGWQEMDIESELYCPALAGGLKMYSLWPGSKYVDHSPVARCQFTSDPATHVEENCPNTYNMSGIWTGEPSFHSDPNYPIVVEFCSESDTERSRNTGRPGISADDPVPPSEPIPEGPKGPPPAPGIPPPPPGTPSPPPETQLPPCDRPMKRISELPDCGVSSSSVLCPLFPQHCVCLPAHVQV